MVNIDKFLEMIRAQREKWSKDHPFIDRRLHPYLDDEEE